MDYFSLFSINRKRFFVFTIPASFVFSSAFAAVEDSSNGTTLPPVIISATRVPTPATEIASSVTIITDSDIEAGQQRTLVDVLRDVPGLNVIQAGGPGSVATIYMRGTNANHIKVLIDGINVSDPSSPDGAFDFSSLLTSNIERIEVLRGPQSGLYGSDAIGGVINIITKKGSGPAQFTATIEGGSFNTFNQTAGFRGSHSKFNYAFDVAHYSAQTLVTPPDLVPSGRPNNPDSYDNKTISTKLGVNLTDTFDLTLVTQYVATTLKSTSDDFDGPQALRSTSDSQKLFSRIAAHSSLFEGCLDQTVGVAYTTSHRTYEDPNTAPVVSSSYDGDRIKADWQANLKLTNGQILTTGLEHQFDKIDTNAPLAAQMTNEAAFIQLQSAFGDQIFNVVTLRDDYNSIFGNELTYRIAPAFLVLATDTKLKASFGTGYKAPTLDQLYNSYPAYGFFANADLKPEKSIGYDVGFEQTLWHKQFQFGSTYFHNKISDLIATNDSFTTNINIGRATTYGFENFISYRPWNVLTLRADYTYTSAKNDILSQELLRRPRDKASLSAIWQATPKLSAWGTLLYVGPWFDVSRDGSAHVNAKGYTTLDIATEYALTNYASLFARGTNLFNQQYQNPIGWQQPGIGGFGGIKLKV